MSDFRDFQRVVRDEVFYLINGGLCQDFRFVWNRGMVIVKYDEDDPSINILHNKIDYNKTSLSQIDSTSKFSIVFFSDKVNVYVISGFFDVQLIGSFEYEDPDFLEKLLRLMNKKMGFGFIVDDINAGKGYKKPDQGDSTGI